jgi:hypothetical protein
MQSSGTTDDLDPGEYRQGSEQPTQALGVDAAPTLTNLPTTSSRDHCGSCGAPLTPDQRYCVECGQRRGRSRVEFMDRIVPAAEPAKEPVSERRLPRFSPNAALIAAVGTLILAMGVGVLIGRWATSEKGGSTQVKLVNLGGATTGTGSATPTTTGSEATSPTTSGTSTPTKSTSTSTSTSKAKASKAGAESTKPKAKVVKLGSKGSGAGYNKKKEFTGEFFGEEEK